jgi:hypothetical protein
VDTDNDVVAAITDIYNDLDLSPLMKAAYSEEDHNYGIVAHSTRIPVYVAIDLDKTAFTKEQVVDIAMSVRIVPTP